MTETMTKIRGILDEMFGAERVAALKDDDKPWHEAIGAKNIDIIDFKCFVQEQFDVQPHAYFFDDKSLREIATYIDAATPSRFPH